MERFQSLRTTGHGTTYSNTYLEQGQSPKQSSPPARSWILTIPPFAA